MQYNNLIYKSNPHKVKDYISNKYNIVHNQLYEDALNLYFYNYTKTLIMKNLFYNLFMCMNNCITPFNDSNTIVNLETLNRLKNNMPYKIFTIKEIKENRLYNYEYINILLGNNNFYTNEINKVFISLDMDEDNKKNYLSYIIVNIISLLDDLKNDIQNINHISSKEEYFSDFIIRYNNTLYILNESDDDFSLFDTEINNEEVFIYEDMIKKAYHIGFNKDGYFILDIDSDINIQDNYQELHYIVSYINSLLLDMLFIDISQNIIESNTIIEIPQDEYYLPSSIYIYGKKYPHKKTKVDLSPYWSNYQDKKDLKFEDIKIIDDGINDFMIEDINYVNGTVNIYSKLNDIKYVIDSNYVNKDSIIDDDMINNTFIKKTKNMLNGE